jgi:hypothetical protein
MLASRGRGIAKVAQVDCLKSFVDKVFHPTFSAALRGWRIQEKMFLGAARSPYFCGFFLELKIVIYATIERIRALFRMFCNIYLTYS